MFLELLGAVAGGMYGLYAASEKERYAKQAAKQGELMYDASKKAYQSAKSGAAMSLTIGAMRNTDRNKASAIEAFQSESELEAAAAVSGTASGGLHTVSDVSEVTNRLAIDRQAEQGQYELAATKLQGDASVAASLVNMASSLFQYQELSSEAEYAKSALAHGLSFGSGVLGGVSTAAGVEKGLYNVGALSDTGDGFIQKAANKIVGLFQAPVATSASSSPSKSNTLSLSDNGANGPLSQMQRPRQTQGQSMPGMSLSAGSSLLPLAGLLDMPMFGSNY